MIVCMTDGERFEADRSGHNHLLILSKLEEFLAAHFDSAVYLSEICAATQASEHTLRICCNEHLGMGPVRYLWLRRMHLARRALLRATEGIATVTSIAMAHGFWELGRFSVTCRGLFDEPPLATLRRPAEDAPASRNTRPLRVSHSRSRRSAAPKNSPVCRILHSRPPVPSTWSARAPQRHVVCARAEDASGELRSS